MAMETPFVQYTINLFGFNLGWAQSFCAKSTYVPLEQTRRMGPYGMTDNVESLEWCRRW